MIPNELVKRLHQLVIAIIEEDGWKLVSMSPDLTIFEKDGEELKLLNSYEWFW